MIIFSDSRTNPSEEWEDDKNHGVPKDSKNYVNNITRTCAQSSIDYKSAALATQAHQRLLKKTMFNLINYVKVKWSI